MADLAHEEADRYFSSKDTQPTSHPEDRNNASDRDSDSDEKDADGHHSDPGTDDDDLDTSSKMATMTQTKTAYHIPTTTQYANTGPKGVIADAQNFARAKQTSFRTRLSNFASTITFNKQEPNVSEKTKKAESNSDGSDLALSEDDSDSEFMNTWRQNRIQELSSMKSHNTRRVSPSRRIWGTLQDVDATGYLDAIEKVSPDDVVVVMIYDPSSSWSKGVEDELGMLAYKHSMTRFVKLDHEIAEMETVEVPAVLAYKAGEVIATISGAKAEGLESVLKKQRIILS